MIIQIGGNVKVKKNWIQLISEKTSKTCHMTFYWRQDTGHILGLEYHIESRMDFMEQGGTIQNTIVAFT